MQQPHTYLRIAFASLVTMLALTLCSCNDDPYADDRLAPLNLCSLGNTHIEGYTDDQHHAPANQHRALAAADQHHAPALAFAQRAPGDDDDDIEKHPFVPSTPDGGVAPDGISTYMPYNELYPVPINKDYTTIGAFLTEDTKDEYNSLSGYFSYTSSNRWDTTVGVKPGQFYLFGYMPSNLSGASASLSKHPGSTTWADGCQLLLKNFSTVTPADVCVVVGALKWANTDTPIYAPSVVAALQQGVYAYEGTETDNFAYLLLDHIYTNVNFELVVEEKYADLRTIVLKKATMRSEVSNTVDATITLGNDPVKPLESISFTKTSIPPASAVLFPEADQYAQAVSSDEEHPTSIPGYFAPGLTDQNFVFEFIYDVYDRHGIDDDHPYGNLVRENCHAVNRWAITGSTVSPGKSFKVKAIIKPTYLYQLSDPDLDNPTMEFTAPLGTTIQVIVDANLIDTMPGQEM